MTNRKKGILWIAVASIMFSTSGFLIKAVTANAVTVAVLRAGISGVAFAPFIEWKKLRFDKNFIALIISYTLLTFCFIHATKMTTAANAIILQCTAPLWIYLFYLLSRRKKFCFSEFWPRLAIIAGIAVILIDPANIGGENGFLGILLGIGAGMAYAVEQLFMEKDYPMNDLSKIGVINLVMAVIFTLIFWNQVTFTGLPTTDWLMLAFLGIFQIGLPYVMLFKGVRAVSAFESSVLVMIEPIFNPIWVCIFIGEFPTGYTIAGYVFILVGIFLTLMPELSIWQNSPNKN